MNTGDIGKILPAELYIVELAEEMQVSFTNALTHLYQPLIGLDALALYQTLYTEFIVNNHSQAFQTHHTLMSYIGLPLDQMYRARRKLEAIGLLQTFEGEHQGNKVYHYLLHPPFSTQAFFADDFLSHLLYHQLGSEKFKRVKEVFMQRSLLEDKEETTAPFEDVFQIRTHHPEEIVEYASPKPSIPLKNKVDFSWLEQVLNQRMLPKEKILTKANRKLINQMASAYDLSNIELEKALIWAISDENELNTTEFTEACLNFMEGPKDSGSLKAVDERQKLQTTTQTKSKSKEDQFIEMMEHISPKQVLEDLANGNQASQQDLKVISDVMTKQGLNPGVMNVLIHYVMLKTDMKLTKSYLEKIASHWARKNVKTVRQAMTLAKSENKKYQQWSTQAKKRYYQPSQKKDVVPDWYKKQKEQTKQRDEQTAKKVDKEKTAQEADALLAQYLAQNANDDEG
ncbi:DnaD domain protein [Gracilibacillus sp. YIM 98692]|uniref:replication initiation and membrane attachment family protein n=1 Tax=Gracilibacillus sp. YIM 98692 TaxID=2663532 RepID=UPI0013D83442|nr:DnaD domain protein [Gracilibacillus sp. YIM 98692]